MQAVMIHPCIYVLALENDRYYVGITMNLNQRLAQHWQGQGSLWTKKFKPQFVLSVKYPATSQDEKEVTLQMMRIYGWENVRGSGWSKIDLLTKPKEI